MEIVRKPIPLSHLEEMAASLFGNLVKAVVDIGQGILAIGGELPADEEALLMSEGSSQRDLWGISVHPGQYGSSDFIEYDSMINIRPSQGNRSRSVESPAARAQVVEIVGRRCRGERPRRTGIRALADAHAGGAARQHRQ
jgi:hypothetical protein